MNKFLQKFFSDGQPRGDEDAYRALIERISDDPRLRAAFARAPRAWFLPASRLGDSARDAPIAIPGGQTNSQPTTVALMLRELDPQPGDRILDVGCGSGWTMALLAVLVGSAGRVYGMEVRDVTYEFGKANMARFREETGCDTFEMRQEDGSAGWPEQALFDRILVSAGAQAIPSALIDQLKPGGRMVIPVNEPDGSHTLSILQKQNDGSCTERRMPGFRFVPLLER